MPPKKQLIHSWVQKGAEDLRLAKFALTANPPFLAPSVYHCQQAVEKIIKAYLLAHTGKFKPVHDIRLLSELVANVDADLGHLLGPAMSLTKFAIAARYPDAGDEITLEIALEAVKLSESMFAAVLEKIKVS